jgi:hypothetical protein
MLYRWYPFAIDLAHDHPTSARSTRVLEQSKCSTPPEIKEVMVLFRWVMRRQDRSLVLKVLVFDSTACTMEPRSRSPKNNVRTPFELQ